MFEYERAPLLGMTRHARFPIRLAEHRLVAGSVCIVTIGAFHEAFRHLVMIRKRKLTLNDFVTAETQAGLRCPQQFVVQPGPLAGHVRFNEMSRVTRLARDAVKLVFGTVKERLILIRDVAGQTALGIFRRRRLEREDQLRCGLDFFVVATRGSHSVNMSLTGTMAGLAGSTRVRSFRDLRNVRFMALDAGFGLRRCR